MINFQFVGDVLKDYKANADIQEIVSAEVISDGAGDISDINLAETYKAIIMLASSDTVNEKVGNITRGRSTAYLIVEVYTDLYDKLLKSSGVGLGSTYPDIVI